MATSKTFTQAEKDKLALVSIVEELWDQLAWQSSLSVAYDPLRPNKSIDLTGHGNIAITNTGTDGRSAGLYSIKQDTTPRTVTINGTAILINPASASKTLIQWVYDGTDYGFSTNYTVPTDISGKANIDSQSAITYAATVTLDFNQADAVRTLALTGNVTFAATSNKAAAKNKVIIITADTSSRTLAFPAWTFIGAAAPTSIAASKTAVLSLYCSGTTEASVIASYSVQP